ncbi:fimbrial biogenesis chaperone [Providencia sp. PROV032]|uniref:fimbrial biogenesis chaperone n=1 Tax=Providencia sp. PROV032 TaxID=2949764 RepID=UPI00234938DD|nr:molecular chaperone [Providencia sp. PROV032]
MIKNSLRALWFFIFIFPLIAVANGQTGFDFVLKRYVYNESDSGGINIDMTNGNAESYLMEAWISNVDEETLLPKIDNTNERVPFIILPPLKKMDANTQNSWNIRRISNQVNGVTLPNDRESLFWIGIRAIPSEEKNKKENSINLNIVPNFYFKLLYRPKEIEELKTSQLAKEVKLSRKGNTLTIENPTPFYLTFDYLKVAGNMIKNGEREITLVPFSTQEITLKSSNPGKIEWRFTDEYLLELRNESIE